MKERSSEKYVFAGEGGWGEKRGGGLVDRAEGYFEMMKTGFWIE